MAIWFTSDLHIGHANILEYCNRPWDDVPSMNDGLVARWNEVVQPGDTVYVMGDLAMGKRHESLEYVKGLVGDIVLVPGNHDYVHAFYDGKKAANQRPAYEAVISNIADLVVYFEGGIRGCHMPYLEGAERIGRDELEEYHPDDDGLPLIHGHVHNEWRIRRTAKGTPMVNVGVDMWDYRPVSFEHVLEAVTEAEALEPGTQAP